MTEFKFFFRILFESNTAVIGFVLFVGLYSCNGKFKKSYPEQVTNYITLLEQNRTDQAKKSLDSVLNSGDPINEQWLRASLFSNDKKIFLNSQQFPFRDLFAVKKEIDKLNLNKASVKLDSLNSIFNLSSSYPFEYFWLESSILGRNRTAHLSFIKKQYQKSLDPVDLKFFVNGLKNLSGKLDGSHSFELQMALTGLGLYLIEKREDRKLFPLTKANLIFQRSIDLIKTGQIALEIINKHLLKAIEIYKNNNWGETSLCVAEFIQTKGTASNSLDVDRILKFNVSLSLKYGLLAENGEKEFFKNTKQSLKYFLAAESILKTNECNYHKKIIQNYLAMTYAEMNLLDSMNFWNKKALSYKTCDIAVIKEYDYVNSIIMSSYFDLLHPEASQDSLMNMLLRERKIGVEINETDIEHQVDYLVENTLRIYSLFVAENVSEVSILKKLIEIFESSKSSDVLVRYALGKIQTVDKKRNKKKELLRKINEFDFNTNFRDPIYQEIFESVFEEYENYSAPVFELNEFKIDKRKVSDVLSNKGQILNLLSFRNLYFGYLVSNNSLHAFEFDGTSIIKLSQQLDSLIHKNLPFQNVVQQLRKEIRKNIPLEIGKDLVIIPDGVFSSLPLEYIFKDFKSVNVEHSLIEYLDRHEVNLDKQTFTNFSYTDSSTLADNSRRIHQELNYGFQETKEISQILNSNNNNQYFTGPNFTTTNFQNNLASDLYHISAHAATNLDNRLDNYIVLRDENGKAKKLYTYEIEAMNAAPKVVILSACDTGIGVHKNGKGTYSISRAFMQNGTQTIIKTLWKVDDSATKDFMVDLYTNWNKGISLGDAINQTREKFESDPNYSLKDWAGFVLEGNPNVFLK